MARPANVAARASGLADGNGTVAGGPGTGTGTGAGTAAGAVPSPAGPAGPAGPANPKPPAGAPRSARSHSPAAPGPRIAKAPSESVAGARPAGAAPASGSGGAGWKKNAAGEWVKEGKASASSPARVTPRRIQDLHATASRRLGLPELTLSADEAAELAESLDALAELTGFKAAGPFWVWIGVLWTMVTIYGGRFYDVSLRRQREAAGAPRALAATAAPPARPPPPAPAAAAAPPVVKVPSIARPSPAEPAPAEVFAMPTDDLALLRMAYGDAAGAAPDVNGGIVAGLTPNIPGVPQTSAAERYDLP